ncbi:hypothetical protein GCM10020331_024770 [Ectobacillus funiculus]
MYDYDRMENGSKRELHLEKAMDVITVPFDDIKLTPVKKGTRGNRAYLFCRK